MAENATNITLYLAVEVALHIKTVVLLAAPQHLLSVILSPIRLTLAVKLIQHLLVLTHQAPAIAKHVVM